MCRSPRRTAGPFPGIFGLGGITPDGVAVINMRNALNQLAESTGSSGRQNPPLGDFYRLYPGFASTGSLMAWAWTASRIIDGLEQATAHNVDTTKLSALGCSRDGKAAATIYQALGTPGSIAFLQPPHTHCAQAGTFAETYYDTFVDRFLRAMNP